MNLPDQPPTFRQPNPGDRPWWWRLENAAGAEVPVDDDDLTGQRFASQADAESWVGETWSDLAAEQVGLGLAQSERFTNANPEGYQTANQA